MIYFYKDRVLNDKKPVKVYRNLHNHLLSVQQKHVIGHADTLFLEDVTFHVQPAGHKETLKKQQKTVHAYAKGMISDKVVSMDNAIEIFYNPYIAGYFRDSNKQPIHKVKFLSIDKHGKMFAIL